jgi:ADP-ribosylglycohydrolase/protein-tyrosine phosphatase
MRHDGTPRTSLTDPLRVDRVTAGAAWIGLTLCPGKTYPGRVGGPWARSLEPDLDGVAATGAHALVTLMEEHELAEVRVPGLGPLAEARGLEWHHLPIRDVDVPDSAFETTWTYAGLRLRGHLRAGRPVVLHCLGGLGRSGLVAARLLIELGATFEDAIQAVRAARPGAIETSGQLSYVRACRPPMMGDSIAERILGALLGGAIGDAFGYAIEFDRWPAIRARYGSRGLVDPVRHRGKLVASDDTQMTLFTLEGQLRAAVGDDPIDSIREAYLDWLATQGHDTKRPLQRLAAHPLLQHQRAPGLTCLDALRAGGTGTVDAPINRSKGCGGVMRVAPLGLVPGRLPTEAFALAVRAAALTHGHPSGYLSAGAMAALLAALLSGADLPSAAARLADELPRWAGSAETAQALALAHTLGEARPGGAEAVARLGEGWVGEEAFAIGLYASLVTDDPASAIRLAANHDGDSDSTASLAGQIRGLIDGASALPHAWVRDLDVLEPLLALAARFLATSTRPTARGAERHG